MPLFGILIAWGEPARCRQNALLTTLFTAAMAAVLVFRYPAGDPAFAGVDIPWLASLGVPLDVRFSVALDGLSVWLFGLTALLMVVAVLISWEAIRDDAPRYYRLLLLLETGMLGVFVARDIILFYVFFEFTLIPLFFLIGIWGSEERQRAAIKFFLFTLAGSVFTFLGLLAIVLLDYFHTPGGVMTFSIPELTRHLAAQPLDPRMQLLLFWALFAGFAIKVPLFPLHTWLPLAHVQAPAAGSVLLAGVLLKIGTYGFLRFSVAMLPAAAAASMPWLLWIAVAGVIYGALVALAQRDMKRLVAYSSVSHLGYCMLGIFALDRLGIQGGTLQMINHGLSTGALFALVGMLYERYHTRQIADLGGLARQTPVLAFFLVFATLSSIGLPGLNNFAGEFLLLAGLFQRAWSEAPAVWALQFRVISVLAVSGLLLGAWYMLQWIGQVCFGPVRRPEQSAHAAPIRDLSFREVAALTPLAVMIVWIGVQPRFFLDRMAPTLDALGASATRAADGRHVSEGGWHVPEERRAWLGTVPIFVSAKMGLSPLEVRRDVPARPPKGGTTNLVAPLPAGTCHPAQSSPSGSPGGLTRVD